MNPSHHEYSVDLTSRSSVFAMTALGFILIFALAFDFAILGLIIVCLTFFAVVSVLRPTFAVFIAAFAIFTNTSMIAAEELGFSFITEGILSLLLIIAIRDWMQKKSVPPGLLRVVPAFGFYVLVLAASLFVTVDVDITKDGLLQTIKTVSLASILICVVTTSDRFAAAIAGILCAASFLSSLTIYQAVTGAYGQEFLGYASNYVLYVDGELSTLRFAGPIGEPNYYAQILLLAYPVSLSMALAGTGRLRSMFFFALSGLIAAAIILTQSRGGFICLIALSVLAVRPSPRNILLVLGSVPLLVLAVMPFVPTEFANRVLVAVSDVRAIVSGYGNIIDTAIAGRVSEMLAAWHLFVEKPWFGFGYGTFESLYQDTARRYDLMARGEGRQAHNLFLEILSETGVAGFLAYASMIAFSLFSAVTAARRIACVGQPLHSAAMVGLALSILGYVASSVFLHEAFQWYLWLILALAVVAPTIHPGVAKVHAEK